MAAKKKKVVKKSISKKSVKKTKFHGVEYDFIIISGGALVIILLVLFLFR